MKESCAKPAESVGCRRLALVILLAAAAGCQREPPPAGTVRGRLTVGGKPVAAGSVLFEADRPRWGTVGMVGADGRYEVADVPAGAVRVGVRTRGVRRFGEPGAEAVAVPRKFEDPGTSGLAYTVRPGEQTIDIELPAD